MKREGYGGDELLTTTKAAGELGMISATVKRMARGDVEAAAAGPSTEVEPSPSVNLTGLEVLEDGE